MSARLFHYFFAQGEWVVGEAELGNMAECGNNLSLVHDVWLTWHLVIERAN